MESTEFHGSWRLMSSENFEAYLKELGINALFRKLAFLVTPIVTFSTHSCFQRDSEKSNEDEAFSEWTIRYNNYLKFRTELLVFGHDLYLVNIIILKRDKITKYLDFHVITTTKT